MTLKDVMLVNPQKVEKFKRESLNNACFMCFDYMDVIVWYDLNTPAIFTREDILANDYIVVTSSTAL